MFGNVLENQALQLAEKADFNHNHIPDKEELAPAAKKLGESVDDLGAAVDVVKVGAAFKKGSEAFAKIEAAIGSDLHDGTDPASVIKALEDPAVQQEAIIALVAVKDLMAAFDQAKLSKAFGEMMEAKAVVEQYLHPKKA